MKREQSGTFLSAVFVDYDNIYLSLKRKSEEAAKRFAKDAPIWLKEIENGRLISPTNGPGSQGVRRIVMNRCYGNPVPRRNASDNSTDMSSFPFVRHHFLRAGFEIIDCPPLTAQLKNSSDIRMVMDVRDYLSHPTYFDEFVILSGDADFTPLLHRLRSHARRTVVFANDYTAVPYTAISDGEVRESDLITLLLEGRVGAQEAAPALAAHPDAATLETIRREIVAEIVTAVRAANAPVPLEVLADRAVRAIGHERTIGTAWAGAGSFRDLLAQCLPEDLHLSGEPPYVVIDGRRHAAQAPLAITAEPIEARAPAHAPMQQAPIPTVAAAPPMAREILAPRGLAVPAAAAAPKPIAQPAHAEPLVSRQPATPAPQPYVTQAALQEHQPAPRQRTADIAVPVAAAPTSPARAPEPVSTANIQQSIARIHDACQAPPLSPPEYRSVFEVMAQEITENGLIGAQTILNITQRALQRGVEVRRDDVRFILEVVSEADPWFEQGATANLFAGRFRNFVVARCRGQGLTLSVDELDLIEAWFAGNGPVAASAAPRASQSPAASHAPASQPVQPAAPLSAPQATMQSAMHASPAADPRGAYWSLEAGRQHVAEQRQQGRATNPVEPAPPADDFPRIVRTRLRG